MRSIAMFCATLALTACAAAQDPKAAAPKKAEDAQPACQATPKELVTKDIKEGEGRAVVFRSSVMVYYTGWLYDGCAPDLKGQQFDTNRERPVPFGFVVGAGRVIKGWDEGLIGMKEKGAKRLLIIPPDKAYGDKGVGDKIPPNAALVFEVDSFGIGYYPGAPVTQPGGQPQMIPPPATAPKQ